MRALATRRNLRSRSFAADLDGPSLHHWSHPRHCDPVSWMDQAPPASFAFHCILWATLLTGSSRRGPAPLSPVWRSIVLSRQPAPQLVAYHYPRPLLLSCQLPIPSPVFPLSPDPPHFWMQLSTCLPPWGGGVTVSAGGTSQSSHMLTRQIPSETWWLVAAVIARHADVGSAYSGPWCVSPSRGDQHILRPSTCATPRPSSLSIRGSYCNWASGVLTREGHGGVRIGLATSLRHVAGSATLARYEAGLPRTR